MRSCFLFWVGFDTLINIYSHDSDKATINLPTYDTVGDYWYTVQETIGSTTGVLYGTNDAVTENTASNNGAHVGTYYIHVQVTESSSTTGTSTLVSNVTMHKTAPTSGITDATYNSNYSSVSGSKYLSETGDKVNAIENRYYAGDLVIKKVVTGNAGDKDEYFPVTVVFTRPVNTLANSDITFRAALRSGDSAPYTYTDTDVTIKGQYYTGDASTNTLKWTSTSATGDATATATFYVKDNDTVTFSNIPYGITYTVSETLPENDTYQNKLEYTLADTATNFDNISLAADTGAATLDNTAKLATGSISDANDTITITNTKNMNIDIGVITEDAPYVALMAVCAGAAVLMVTRKKRIFED